MPDTITIPRMDPADVDSSSVEALIGDDDFEGVLDRYKLEVIENAAGKPVIVWRCREGCGNNGNGYVGVIARNTDLDQSGLTLGELVGSALRHAQDEHGEDYGLDEL